MTIVALTGGIAAGKSTVSTRLADHGILVIDADQVARDVVEPGSGTLSEIIKEFGQAIELPDGRLNREALGAIVFSDPEARQQLNAIVHPAVKARSKELFRRAELDEPHRVVVYAVPLVAESGRGEEFDLIVVVDAPRAQRISRLMQNRGLSLDEATARVDSQASDEERRAIADVVVDASGSLEETLTAADHLAKALISHWPHQLSQIAPRFSSDQS
jgi:dephospho-CoA kinase